MHPLIINVEHHERGATVRSAYAFADSPVRVGRNTLNELQLEASFVSQWHGVFRFDAEQTTYLDLGAKNPTLVNGAPARRNVEIAIGEETELLIGSLLLRATRAPAPVELLHARRLSAFSHGVNLARGDSATTFYAADRSADPRTVVASPSPHTQHVQSPPSVSAAEPLTRIGLAVHSLAPDRIGSEVVGAGLDQELQQLRAQHRENQARLRATVRERLARAPAGAREALFDSMVGQVPELGYDPEFRSALSALGIDPLRTGVPEMAGWLQRLSGGALAGGNANVAVAMERIGEALEVFSTAFVELHAAHESFCSEFSLHTPLEKLNPATRSPRGLLAYLLDPSAPAGERVAELARGMTDLAVHQVALAGAVVEGAREVFEELSPHGIAADATSGQVRRNWLAQRLSSDKARLWDHYVSRFSDATDEDRFTRKLFGRSFVRYYHAMTGAAR